jgi:monofunctional biosynthetic peptidoglycan transglycosylase
LRLITKIFFLSIAAVMAFSGFTLISLPDPGFLVTHDPLTSSYRLEEFGGKTDPLTFVPLSQISPSLVSAVLVAEDDLFFTHDGFNWLEVKNAVRDSLDEGRTTRGASTITQQLARNLFLDKDKSIIRKLKEAYLSWQIEKTLSKGRILELYLNIAEFGPGLFGAAAGSQYHFGKKPNELTAAEASLMAAVLPNPKLYGRKPYPRYTASRQKQILFRVSHYDLNFPAGLFKAQIKDELVLSEPPKIKVKTTEKLESKKVPTQETLKIWPPEAAPVSQIPLPPEPNTHTIAPQTLEKSDDVYLENF